MRSFTAMQYLMIDIANSFGLDQEVWDQRLAWFRTNEVGIHDDTMELARHAKEPAQFVAGVQAYKKALNGQPTGYLCQMDATASGLQILSLLAGCEQSASICNLVNTGRREDAYLRVYAHMGQMLGSVGAVTRKAVKAALMTHLYGSKAEPKKAFGEDTPELAAFYQAIGELLPGANVLNHDLLNLWQPDALVNEWILPDGFEVKVKVMASVEHPVTFLGQTYAVTESVNMPKPQGLSLGANIIHSIDGMIVREMNRRCNFDVEQLDQVAMQVSYAGGGTYTLRKKDLELLRILELYDNSGFMSAVVINHIDIHNVGHLDAMQRAAVLDLITSMPRKAFPIVCIHDCFKFHPNYGNDVRQQYVNILAELAESNVLSSIASQVAGKLINVKKISNNVAALIRQSEYSIT